MGKCEACGTDKQLFECGWLNPSWDGVTFCDPCIALALVETYPLALLEKAICAFEKDYSKWVQ
jgi:hypothetical protein